MMRIPFNIKKESEMQIIENQTFTPLALETRSVIPTDAAAHHLNRKPQTLRTWACFENGLIKPIRINGRLAWSVDDIRELLGVTTPKGGE
jgi:hypothetical protein